MSDKVVKTEKEIEPRDMKDYHLFCKLRAKGETLKEIGEKIGYAESTLNYWKDRSDYEDLILKYRKKYKREDLVLADKCVRNEVESNNLKAAELVYKREGELSDNQTNIQVNISIDDFIDAEKTIDKK